MSTVRVNCIQSQLICSASRYATVPFQSSSLLRPQSFKSPSLSPKLINTITIASNIAHPLVDSPATSTRTSQYLRVHLQARQRHPTYPRLPPFSNNLKHFHTSRLPPAWRSNHYTMSTLSQPQTPAAIHSPLREHRHRPVERLTEKLERPSLDSRIYRVVRLPNQLEVLLVQDAETDKASAAMDVNVGNFSDDGDMPGMAHAVE